MSLGSRCPGKLDSEIDMSWGPGVSEAVWELKVTTELPFHLFFFNLIFFGREFPYFLQFSDKLVKVCSYCIKRKSSIFTKGISLILP